MRTGSIASPLRMLPPLGRDVNVETSSTSACDEAACGIDAAHSPKGDGKRALRRGDGNKLAISSSMPALLPAAVQPAAQSACRPSQGSLRPWPSARAARSHVHQLRQLKHQATDAVALPARHARIEAALASPRCTAPASPASARTCTSASSEWSTDVEDIPVLNAPVRQNERLEADEDAPLSSSDTRTIEDLRRRLDALKAEQGNAPVPLL